MTKTKKVIIYTDGSSLGNPGPGGWAAVLIYGPKRKEISGGFRSTTNNRMELYAAIRGLEAIKRSDKWTIELHTDSRYLADAVNKGWLESWRRRGWKRKSGEILNLDLWKRFWKAYEARKMEIVWERGHSGVKENERCDELAKKAAQEPNLPRDEEYERYYGNKKG